MLVNLKEINEMLPDKNVKIPDEDIERTMKGLDVSKEEAIEIWLDDEGYLENEEQEQLCKKAKDNRITAAIHQATSGKERKKVVRERKENPVKEDLISKLAAALQTFGNVDNIAIENVGKLITFRIGVDEFKLDLIQKRKKKGE